MKGLKKQRDTLQGRWWFILKSESEFLVCIYYLHYDFLQSFYAFQYSLGALSLWEHLIKNIS